MSALSDKIAVWFTNRVGTMTCAYMFLTWSLLPLLFPAVESLVSYVSQSVIQLVLLPLIMVGQSVMNRASDECADDMHSRITDLMELIGEVREELVILKDIQSHVSSGSFVCQGQDRLPGI